jgi:hypothetical protein
MFSGRKCVSETVRPRDNPLLDSISIMGADASQSQHQQIRRGLVTLVQIYFITD